MNRRRIVLVVAALLTFPAVAEDLGRLFYTPAERASLDRARRARDEVTVLVEPPAEVALEPAPDNGTPEDLDPGHTVRVDGYVQRSAGPPTVWVNGTDSYQGNLAEFGIDVARLRLERAGVRVPLGDAGAGVLLKPGQSFDRGTARISDAYEQRGGDAP